MNYKLVFHILGMILRVEAVLMLPAAVIGLATGQDGSAFLLSAATAMMSRNERFVSTSLI